MNAAAEDVSKFHIKTRLHSLVGQTVNRFEDDRPRAAEIVEAAIAEDDELFMHVMRPHLARVVWELVKQRKTTARKPTTVPTRDEPQPGTQTGTTKASPSTEALHSVAARNWLEYPMFNGKPLGDANRSQLQRAIDHHRDEARVSANQAAMLNMLAQRVGNETVRNVFTNDQITRFAARFGL